MILFPDGYKLDVASARLEYYLHPGALPDIEHASVKLDLYRRDFTINTLAIALNPAPTSVARKPRPVYGCPKLPGSMGARIGQQDCRYGAATPPPGDVRSRICERD